MSFDQMSFDPMSHHQKVAANKKTDEPVKSDEFFSSVENVLDHFDRPVEDEGSVWLQDDLVSML
jgi:hypothetical protein